MTDGANTAGINMVVNITQDLTDTTQVSVTTGKILKAWTRTQTDSQRNKTTLEVQCVIVYLCKFNDLSIILRCTTEA